ncbi:MAG: autotransporter outer membrane beta-barrel domain-containing protein [Akkermansia sp.]|nr:autotransporter outer membrane beta-barrel domain-containing protein [Akkermansia sp.]
MKKTKLLLAVLAICPMVGYTYADVVDFNYSDYSSFQQTVTEGKLVTVAGTGNGEDYSRFDMYEGDSPNSGKKPDFDKGFILGGSANGLVSTNASGNPTVESVSITTNGITGASIAGIGFASCSVTGAIDIDVNGGTYNMVIGGVAYELTTVLPVDSGSIYNAPEKSAGNNISITLNNGADVYLLYGGHYFSGPVTSYFGSRENDAYPSENYDKLMADNPWAVGGNVDIVVNDARIGGLYASGNNMHSVDGNVSVKIYSGEVYGEFVAGPMSCHSHIGGDMKLLVTGDAEIKCAIYGGHWVNDTYMTQGAAPTIKGDTSFEFSGQSVMHNDVFLLGPGVHLEGDGRVSLQDNAEIKGTLYAKHSKSTVSEDTELSLTVGGANNKPYIGSVGGILRFDKMVVSEDSRLTLTGSNVFDTPRQTYTINEGNRTTAVITLTDKASVSVDKPLSLAVNFKGNGAPGRYKIIDASAVKSAVDLSGWNADMVTMVGGNIPFEDMFWEDEVLYIMFEGKPVIPIDLDFADAVKASGWAIFSGGQAFSRAITANHFNSVQLNANAYSADAIRSGKEGITYGATGRTIAWFSGYGQLGRISGNGADYGLYGAAVGLERKFGQHRSIGLAFGYDWGKISPFSCSSIDQDSMRFAVYGQYGTWKAGSGNIVLDWSVAYGDTTSSHDNVEGDWSQDSWLFDLRGTYFRRVSNRSVGYGFMSGQYYEQSGATVGNMEFSSMKNLRLKAGGGMSYAVSPRTSVYGEAALFYDAVREDSCMYADGECYEGTNPGRTGVNVGVGASYIINDRWTARGNYSFDAAKDHIEHNMDFGVIYSF